MTPCSAKGIEADSAGMGELSRFTAQVMPLERRETTISFDDFVVIAMEEVQAAFEQIERPDGDLAPFTMVADGLDAAVITWSDLSEETHELWLSGAVPATIAAQRVSMAALVLTVYMGPRNESGALGAERTESMLLGVLQVVGDRSREAAYAATIERRDDGPPNLLMFELVGEKLPAALARPLYKGLLGELDPADEADAPPPE